MHIANKNAAQVLLFNQTHVAVASVLAAGYSPEAIAVDATGNLYLLRAFSSSLQAAALPRSSQPATRR